MARSRRSFLIGPCLGKGGFGEVYRATMRVDGGLDTTVAVKLLRADLAVDADAVRRLRDEGRMLARLDHPAIVRVHDLIELEGRTALVAEFIDGADLGAIVAAEGPLPPRVVAHLAGATADALAAAWRSLRIVHRDIKPTNVRVGRHGVVKLLDFGIARTEAIAREARTASDVVVGSVPYLAPERFASRSVSPASDVFALGCLMYEALTGERFYVRLRMRDISEMSLDRERFEQWRAKRLARLDGQPESLREWTARMLAFDAGERPGADAVAAEMDALGAALPGEGWTAWARGRAWGAGPVPVGGLEGRELVEKAGRTTPAPPRRVGVPGRARQPARWVVWSAVGAAAAVLAVAGIAAAGWTFIALSAPTPVVPPARPPVAAPTPAAMPPPVTERPTEVSGSLPSPKRTEERRTPPIAPPTVPPGGRVIVHAPVPVELRSGERRYALPASVPEGVYQLYVDAGEGFAPATNVTVAAGEVLELRCSAPPVACAAAP